MDPRASRQSTKHPAAVLGLLSYESPEGKNGDLFIGGLAFKRRERSEREKDFRPLCHAHGVGDGRRTAKDGAGFVVGWGAATQ